MANSSSGDSVLVRLDRVLAAFGRDQPRLSCAQIARRTGLPRVEGRGSVTSSPSNRVRVVCGVLSGVRRSSRLMSEARSDVAAFSAAKANYIPPSVILHSPKRKYTHDHPR